MRINRRVALGLGAVLLAGSLPLLAAPASATTNPPWEPDSNAVGTLTFYDASGNVVTDGSAGTDTHLFDYAAASTTDTTLGTKATLVFANPTPPDTTPTGTFPTGQASDSTSYPNASAPAPLTTDPNPVVTVSAGNGNLATFIQNQTVNTGVAGYENVYQIRVQTSGAGSVGTTSQGTYWDADVEVASDGSWVETYPVQGTPAGATTTMLAADPASSASQHQSVTLTATVAATDLSHPAGSVEFFQDGTSLGTGTFNASTGVGTLTTTALLPSAPGGTSLTATFTPTDTATYGASTSSGLAYTVNPVAAKPGISGPHQVGGTEKCAAKGLTFGVTPGYVWLVGGKQVATGSHYKVAASAYKKSLSCKVTVHDGAGPSSSATSSAVTVSLGKALKSIKKPKLSGPHKTGKKETVSHGTWSPAAKSYSYQWFAGKKKIKGATKSSFKAPASDKGKTISAQVTAHKTGYGNGSSSTQGVKYTK